MDIDEQTMGRLLDAGATSVRFNCPLGDDRAEHIADFVALHGDTAVDLGCGQGALAVEIAARHDNVNITGLDTDAEAIGMGRATAARRGVSDRVRFVVADATTSTIGADVVLCIGSCHAFGGPIEAMARLYGPETSAAVVADLVWTTGPSRALLDVFRPASSRPAGARRCSTCRRVDGCRQLVVVAGRMGCLRGRLDRRGPRLRRRACGRIRSRA